MRYIFILIFYFFCFSLYCQNENWSIYFENNRAPFFIDNYRQSDLIIFEGPAFNDPNPPCFKIISTTGDLLKQVDCLVSDKPFIHKVKNNYVVSYVDFGYYQIHEIRFTSKLFDIDLNLLQDTTLSINIDWCPPNNSTSCYVGSYQSMLTKNDSSLFLVGSIGHRFDSTFLFSANYNELGYFQNFKLDNRLLKKQFEFTEDLKILPLNDTSFYLNLEGNFEIRDFNLNSIKKTDYSGDGNKQIRLWYVSDFYKLKDSSLLMIRGTSKLNPDFTLDPKITIGKWNSNLNLDINDTVNIAIRPVGEAFHNILTSGGNQVIFPVDSENEVFYSIFSYFNQLTEDTSDARILVVKFNKDLEVLCSKNYVARNREIIFRSLALNNDGNIYGASLSGTKLFDYQDIVSEIVKIGPDCKIEGMETIEEYLGELSIFENEPFLDFHLLQNPVSDKLVIFSSMNVTDKECELQLFNSSGKLIEHSKMKFNDNQIKLPVSNYLPGFYFYNLKISNKLVYSGKFIKI